MRELAHRSGGGGGVCRMSATEGSGSDEGGEAEGGAGSEGTEEAEAAAKGGDEGDGEVDEKPVTELPDWVTPTREELEVRFPNVPSAPYPVLPDPRDMTKKQLAKAANQGISYGGQVCFAAAAVGGGGGGAGDGDGYDGGGDGAVGDVHVYTCFCFPEVVCMVWFFFHIVQSGYGGRAGLGWGGGGGGGPVHHHDASFIRSIYMPEQAEDTRSYTPFL